MAVDVVNERFFHINSAPPYSTYPLLKVGDMVEVGKTTNPFFGFYETRTRTYDITENNQPVPVGGLTWLKRVQAGTLAPNNAITLVNIAVDVAKHFHMLARELLWENVRLSAFPSAPSRQRCMFLLENLDNLPLWQRMLSNRPANLVEMTATGRILHVDQNWLPPDDERLPSLYDKARRYWEGEMTGNPTREVLFEGKATVDRIVQTFV